MENSIGQMIPFLQQMKSIKRKKMAKKKNLNRHFPKEIYKWPINT